MSGPVDYVCSDDLQVGDVLPGFLRRAGAVVAIRAYENCPFGEGWRVATLADGAEVTLEPGGLIHGSTEGGGS